MNDYRARLFADKPSDWRIDKLGNLFKEREEKGYPDLPLLAVTGGSGIVLRDQLNRRDTSSEDKSKYRLLKVGDIAYNTMRLWQGVLGLSQYEGIVSPAYTVLKPQDGVHAPFFHYLMKTPWMINSFLRYSSGLCSDTNNCKYESFRLIKTLVPPFPEQRRIAEVLGSMDESIEKNQSLIAKLQDLKKATLHELLTKGIGHTEFKESPVGRIPGRWEAVRLGKLLNCIEAGKSPDCPGRPATSSEWGVLKVGAIRPDGFADNENKAVANSAQVHKAYEVRAGDLLMSRANTYELVGLVCYVDKTRPKLMLCDKTLRLIVNPNLAQPEFIFHVLQTPVVRKQIEDSATGTSSSMKNISQNAITGLLLPQPSLEEQKQITCVIDAIDIRIRTKLAYLQRLHNTKLALAQDLLTGRVRVKV